MYKRAQLSILKSRMAEPRRTIHVVMGPRQVGKSTMIDQFVIGNFASPDFGKVKSPKAKG